MWKITQDLLYFSQFDGNIVNSTMPASYGTYGAGKALLMWEKKQFFASNAWF
jgi:hypothetical protein